MAAAVQRGCRCSTSAELIITVSGAAVVVTALPDAALRLQSAHCRTLVQVTDLSKLRAGETLHATLGGAPGESGAVTAAGTP